MLSAEHAYAERHADGHILPVRRLEHPRYGPDTIRIHIGDPSNCSPPKFRTLWWTSQPVRSSRRSAVVVAHAERFRALLHVFARYYRVCQLGRAFSRFMILWYILNRPTEYISGTLFIRLTIQ